MEFAKEMVDYSPDHETLNHTVWARVIIGIIMVVITILTILGNSLVTISVIKFPSLRCPTNYVIVSLAFADLTVGLAVMTLAMVYEMEQHWSLGDLMCNVWITLDVMCCTSSILHICAIAIDRYIAIMKPLHYPLILTNKRLTWTLVSIWVLSFLFAFLPNYFNLSTSGVPRGPKDLERQCYYINSPIYALVTSILTFYVPLVLMTVLYFKIIQVARHQAKDIAQTCTYRPPPESTYSTAAVTVLADIETTQIETGNGVQKDKVKQDIIPSVVVTESRSGDHFQVNSSDSSHGDSESDIPKCSWELPNGCDIIKLEPQRKLSKVQIHRSFEDVDPNIQRLQNKGLSKTCKSRSITNLNEVCSIVKSDSMKASSIQNLNERCKVQSDANKSLNVSSNSNGSNLAKENSLLHGLSMFPAISRSKLNLMAKIRKNKGSDSPVDAGARSSPSRAAAKQQREENKKLHRREYRAAKTLGLIMVGFCVCWLPFFIIYTVHPFKPSLVTSPHIPKVAVWLGYFNSCINPYLYACTRDFRRAFYKLMWCTSKSHSINL